MRRAWSGLQACGAPRAVRVAAVLDAVVEGVGAALPEFDGLRNELVPAPGRWERHLTLSEAGGDLGHARLERLPRGDLPALVGCPCRELAGPRARGPVGERLGVAKRPHLSGQPHLAIEPGPPERRRPARIGGEIAP